MIFTSLERKSSSSLQDTSLFLFQTHSGSSYGRGGEVQIYSTLKFHPPLFCKQTPFVRKSHFLFLFTKIKMGFSFFGVIPSIDSGLVRVTLIIHPSHFHGRTPDGTYTLNIWNEPLKYSSFLDKVVQTPPRFWDSVDLPPKTNEK